MTFLRQNKYEINGVTVEINIDDRRICELLEDFFSYYKSDTTRAPDITFQLEKNRPRDVTVPADAYWFLNYNGIAGFVYEDIFYYVSLGSIFVFDPARNRVEGVLSDEIIEHHRAFTHGVFTIILNETLRYHGLYFIHAAALESPAGRSFVVTGDSGSGKTTFAVASICNGWKWLTDDSLFLRNGSDRLEILPFRRPFHIPPKLAGRIESLRHLLDEPEYFPDNPKRAFRTERIYGDQRVESMRGPDVILFTKIVDEPSSRVEKMSLLEGVNQIIRNSPYVLFSQGPAKEHLDSLKKAVQAATCYRFYAGRDMLEDPAGAVAEVVENI